MFAVGKFRLKFFFSMMNLFENRTLFRLKEIMGGSRLAVAMELTVVKFGWLSVTFMPTSPRDMGNIIPFLLSEIFSTDAHALNYMV